MPLRKAQIPVGRHLVTEFSIPPRQRPWPWGRWSDRAIEDVLTDTAGARDSEAIRAAGTFMLLFGLAFLAPAVWPTHAQLRILASWPVVDARGAGSEVATYREKRRTVHAQVVSGSTRLDTIGSRETESAQSSSHR